jgi:ABC-2 type transport system permease protein
MTAVTDHPRAGGVEAPLVVLVRDVLISGWTKLRSVRSTMWSLLIAAVTALGGSVILAYSVARAAKQPFDPLASIYVAWLEYPVLAIGILGVLVFTSEFSTGQIRTTFVAVPRRRAVLAAKAAVIGALTLVFGEVLSFTAFFLSHAIISNPRGLSIGQARVLESVVDAGVTRCAVALLGVALGAILRHTAATVDRKVPHVDRVLPDRVTTGAGAPSVTHSVDAGRPGLAGSGPAGGSRPDRSGYLTPPPRA